MSYFFYCPLNNCFPYSVPQYNLINPLFGTQSSFNCHLSQRQFFQQQSLKVSQDEAQNLQNQIQRAQNLEVVEEEPIVKKQQKIKKKRGIDKEKQLQSAKKNSESNIINQFFSFFSTRMQADDVVQRAVTMSVAHIEDLQKIKSIFYNVIKCMSIQRVKKYVNKKTLMNVFEKENIQKEIPQILEKFQKISFVSIDQICEVIRRCCLFFLRSLSLISILSSKRISSVSKFEHLKKRRHITGVVSGRI